MCIFKATAILKFTSNTSKKLNTFPCRTCLLSHISCCFFCWQLRTRRNNLRWWPPCKSHGFHQEVCFLNFMKPPKKKENIQITRLNDFCKQTQTLPESSPFFFLLFLGREEANIRKQFSSLDGDHTEIGKFGPIDGSVASFLFLRLEPLGCIETKPLWITNDNSGHHKIVAPKLFLGEGLKTKRTVVFRCFLGWSFQMPRCPRRASCDTDLLRRNDAKQSCTEYNNIHKSNKYNTSKGILVYSPIPGSPMYVSSRLVFQALRCLSKFQRPVASLRYCPSGPPWSSGTRAASFGLKGWMP